MESVKRERGEMNSAGYKEGFIKGVFIRSVQEESESKVGGRNKTKVNMIRGGSR